MTQTNSTVHVHDGWKITFRERRFDTNRSYYAKTRVYVSDTVSDSFGGAKLAELQAAERALGDRRYATRGVYPDVDKLYDRLNREIGRTKREVAISAVEKVLNRAVGGRFSRTAGCSCPCSPGVIMADRLLSGRGLPVDVWVELA